jgi:hypothetical protein
MECVIGEKRIRQLREVTGLSILCGTVRGDTRHAVYVRVWREGEMQSWVIARRGRQVVKWYRDEGGAGAEGGGYGT